jgi:hypothetical protein
MMPLSYLFYFVPHYKAALPKRVVVQAGEKNYA